LQGVQQFARAAAGEAAPAAQGEHSGFNFGLDLLAAWRAARWGNDTAVEASVAVFAPWLEVLANMSTTGPAREYVKDARELASLHAECQRLEASLSVILQRVQHEALVDLQQQVAARAQSAEPVRSFQQLYTLWIECGERAYAQAAHEPEFIRLQAEFANRALHMRRVQRRLAERMAHALDLPTRAEVNALHVQVRDLKRRLNEMNTDAGAREHRSGSCAARR
jgi:class III poly(R)-hydroxyalkanoic acid synthase PhaE subunit